MFAANNLNNTIAGVELSPNGVNNSANSLFVIGFAALIGLVWLWMAKKKIEPKESMGAGGSGSFEGPVFSDVVLKKDIHKFHNSNLKEQQADTIAK